MEGLENVSGHGIYRTRGAWERTQEGFCIGRLCFWRGVQSGNTGREDRLQGKAGEAGLFGHDIRMPVDNSGVDRYPHLEPREEENENRC